MRRADDDIRRQTPQPPASNDPSSEVVTISGEALDVFGLERLIRDAARRLPVDTWRVDTLDLWPLLNNAAVSLAIQQRIAHRKGIVSVGSLGWKAAVALDHAVLLPIRRMAPAKPAPSLGTERLDGRILYSASRVHARSLGPVTVTAPLDVPATLMRRHGHEGVFWFEDLDAEASILAQCLNPPAHGVASALGAARAAAWRPSIAAALDRLDGFREWCGLIGDALGSSPKFMRLWFCRLTQYALAARDVFSGAFRVQGVPKLLVMVNGGFSTTTGLIAAARGLDVPVVEVQHGATSECAVSARGMEPHFSRFNSHANAIITWELAQRDDAATLAVGPIGLHLVQSVTPAYASDLPSHRALASLIETQRAALASHVSALGRPREVLVSLQPGDTGDWVAGVSRGIGPDVLFWVRRHGAQLAEAGGAPGGGTHSRVSPWIESEKASSTILAILLERCHVHLTRYSAVALEAAAAGVPTIAIEAYAGALFRDAIPQSLIEIETNEHEFPAALRRRFSERNSVRTQGLPTIRKIPEFLENVMLRGNIMSGRP